MITTDTLGNLTDADLLEYFKGRRKSPIYEECKKMYEELKTHADGLYPRELIEERRPHESDSIHAFRKKIYQPKTKETISAVNTSLDKIRRSSDWSIDYDTETQNSAIKEGETLYDYCEKNFPMYGSITNWVFGVLKKEYLIDPNGIIVVCPLAKPANDLEYLKPYPIIFNSDQILDYIENQYAVLKSLNKYNYTDKKPEGEQGEMWYVIKPDVIETWAEYNSAKDIKMVDSYAHNLGYIPIIRIKAVFLKTHEEYCIWESRISSMVPSLNEAVREYSDLQGAKVGAMYPEKWEWSSQPCQSCMDRTTGISTGKILESYGKQQKQRYITCPSCMGTGTQPTSGPYKKFIVRASKENMGEQAAPIPPFGYVPKGDVVEIIKAMDESVKSHKYEALSSVNMQFLMQVPLSISGDAKMVDRDELNNFVYGIAEDLVRLMDALYYLIADYRYRVVVPDAKKRRELCPEIPVPQKFDLLSSQYLIEEITKAGDSGLSDVSLKAFEIDFCSKKFADQPKVKEELELNFKLDPLAAKTEDEKLAIKQGGGCREVDYIISCNIGFYVKKAMAEHEDFYEMQLTEQMGILEGYTKEVTKANSLKPAPAPAKEEVVLEP